MEVSLELLTLQASFDQLIIEQSSLALQLRHLDIVLGLKGLQRLSAAVKLGLEVLLLLLEGLG